MSAVISLIAIFLLHQPSLSLHKIVIGDRVFTFFEMAALELIVGAVTSLLVVAVCALVSRRLSIAMIVVAATVQILWIEFEWGFSVKATDAKEMAVRFAGELGVEAATAALMFWKSKRAADLRGQGHA